MARILLYPHCCCAPAAAEVSVLEKQSVSDSERNTHSAEIVAFSSFSDCFICFIVVVVAIAAQWLGGFVVWVGSLV